jgi:hypothetical protein
VRAPVRVTFDTNTYSVAARPQLGRIFSSIWPVSKDRLKSIRDRFCWWYLNWCIRRGRIIAGIPEATLKSEVLPNVERVSALLAVGTAAAATPPTIPETRRQIIEAAFDTGFAVLRSPRISWGALYPVPPEWWALDTVYSQSDRLDRESTFVRHFKNFPLEALKDYGEQLSNAHNLRASPAGIAAATGAAMNKITIERYLWREGLDAEESRPVLEASVKAFQSKLRNLLADWVDLDVVGVHYGYGFDILCSQDRGPSPTSIFSPSNRTVLETMFNVQIMNVVQLTNMCLRRFGLPLTTWR